MRKPANTLNDAIGVLGMSFLHELVNAVRNLHYGSIEILIHDSKIVQLERKEKMRFRAESRSQ